MNQDYIEYARTIHHTVRKLQERIAVNFQRSGKEIAELAVSNLTLPQCNALLTIRDHAPFTIKEFAERLHVSAPSASVMADKLVEMGLVARSTNPADRRAVLIELTSEGATSINTLEAELFSTIAGLMERLGEEKSRQWRGIYAEIGNILAEEDGTPAEPRRGEEQPV